MTTRQIFITYRRSDSRADAGRLYDRLDARYPGRVFRDVGSLEPGIEWHDAIEKALKATAICLVVIGPHWLDAVDANGKRRIDDPLDNVRKEISTSLKSGIRIIPLLVGGATMPAEAELPEELRELAGRNALQLSEQDFGAGFDKLVKAIDGSAPQDERRTWAMTPSTMTAAAVSVLFIAGVVTYVSQRPSQPLFSVNTPGEVAAPTSSSPSAPENDRASVPSAQTSNAPISGVSTGLGTITMKWNGVQRIDWQILDAATHKAVRHEYGSRAETTLDIGAGEYLVAVDGASEIEPIRVKVVAGAATTVAPAVGQLTMKWSGTNAVDWQILNAATQKAIRHEYGSRAVTVLDIGPGDYRVTIDGASEIEPIRVKVVAGAATTVAPAVGQLTMKWSGTNAVDWQILNAATQKAIRHEYGSRAVTVLDIGPGDYRVTLDGASEIEPIRVKVVAGAATTVAPAVGQLMLKWNGAPLDWQAIEVNTKKTVRHIYGSTENTTIDLGPGSYIITLDGKPEVRPFSATVTANRTSSVNVR